MSEFFPKKGITRSLTFDDRPRSKIAEEAKTFSKLSKRAQTFVSSQNSQANSIFDQNSTKVEFSDVIFRRYFGMQGESVKAIPPLNMNFSSSDLSNLTTTAGSDSASLDLTVGENDAVIIVDVFSTGAMIANLLYQLGYKIICVLSGDLKDLLNMKPEGMVYSFVSTLVFDVNIDSSLAHDMLVSEIRDLGFNLVGALAGAETGVELADYLSERLQLTTNGTLLTEARRNKYVMGETVRAAGIRAVKQMKATVWAEINAWLEDWNPEPFKVIVKPMDSAGSDDVTLCLSIAEVQAAFGNIMGKVNGLGMVNKGVLVQEYLEGTEYIVDTVSCDGEHKVVAIWEYDRRAVNGAGFVCFGQRMMTIDEPRCREIVEYQKKVITALGIRHGPTHGEVKWFKGEPVLVEVGARCQGGDGLWVSVAIECFGYNQVQATYYSYFNRTKFNELPSVPTERHSHAILKWLITYEAGILEKASPIALREICSMDSYRGHQIFIPEGKMIKPTQNCFTWGGCVCLANKDEKKLKAQYQRLEYLEKSTLFMLKSAPVAPEHELVVVVDPFSTGAVIASELTRLGYGVVAAYSAKLDTLAKVQSLVPQGLTLAFEAVVGYDENVYSIVNSIMAIRKPVIAVLAGANTGIELATVLSDLMGLRQSGIAHHEDRRKAFITTDTLRSAGIRAIRQFQTDAWSEVESFLDSLSVSPLKLLAKPDAASFSSEVALCHSREEIKEIFDKNQFISLQESHEGAEYVVDTVSRDGVHKVVAIWQCDCQHINDISNVCLGEQLLTMDNNKCKEIVKIYVQAVNAVKVRNGPTTGRVFWVEGDGPIVTSLETCCHGNEGSWQQVSDFSLGYNQIRATIDAYVSADRFEAIPDEPSNRSGYGCLLFLILQEEGTLESVNPDFLEELEQMSSFLSMEIYAKKGAYVKKTSDTFTSGGCISLAHADENQLRQDCLRVREMEGTGLFIFQ